MLYNYLIILLVITSTSAFGQDEWGVYLNISNTTMLNKDAEYNKAVFNTTSDFNDRQPYYGKFISKSATWHKSFGVFYRLPFDKEKINYFLTAGVATYGHKEILNGGKSEDYPYGFYQNLPPGDTAIKISNNYRNYYFKIGFKIEVQVKSKFFFEIEPGYLLNKNNHDKSVKIFRSVFDPVVSYQGGNEKGKDYAFKDVNYNGILFLQSGINYQIGNQLKLHLLYSVSVTPVNKNTEIKKMYYRGFGLQLSYSAF
jgi:hypothetical protein